MEHALPTPSFIIRLLGRDRGGENLLHKKILGKIAGRTVALYGTILSRSSSAILFVDSFSRISLNACLRAPPDPRMRCGEIKDLIDASIRKGAAVSMRCRVRRRGGTHLYLLVEGVKEIGVYEEMYRTLEMMRLWDRVVSPMGSVAKITKDISGKQIDK